MNLKDLINKDETFGSVLLTAFVDKYGIEAIYYDPETILLELQQDCGIVPEKNYNKLMAAIELLLTDKFYVNLQSFIRICKALYDGELLTFHLDMPQPEECTWSIFEANMIWPQERKELFFSEDIKQFVEKLFLYYGIIIKPKTLLMDIQNLETINRVAEEYTDDATMFKAIYERAKSAAKRIDGIVAGKLANLIKQLSELNLQNGNVTENFLYSIVKMSNV